MKSISSYQLAKQFNLEVHGEDLYLQGISGNVHPQENYLIPIYTWDEQTLLALEEGNCFLLSQALLSEIQSFPTGKKYLNKTFLISENPKLAVIELLNFFDPFKHPDNSSNFFLLPSDITSLTTIAILEKMNTVLSPDIKLGPNVTIGSQSQIQSNAILMGNNFIGHQVTIGRNVLIHPQVVIHNGCVIGDHTIIHSGTVIGSDGFGYEPTPKGLKKVPQIGNVIVGNHVEIGSNCSLDRATINNTRIGDRTKIDNLVQIAHNVEIGSDCIIVAQTGIAGSCKIGNRVTIGGQVGIADHVIIEDDVQIGSKSAIQPHKIIPRGSKLQGIPALDFRQQARIYAFLKKSVKRP